jgi:hypothetical protein
MARPGYRGAALRGAAPRYPRSGGGVEPGARQEADMRSDVGWRELGAMDPAALAGARAQTHWAAQVISAAGETFLAHLPDTSHTAMAWDAGLGALAGAAIPGPEACRVAVRVRDLALLLVDADGKVSAETSLAGTTLAEAYAWASWAVAGHRRGRLARPLVHPDYELPPHALGRGGRFAVDAAAQAELARWFADADAELRRFAARTPGAGPVLCWPHHFDIATLVVVEADAAGQATKTIGVGLSPGDEFVAEPYWYVNHGPEAEHEKLPPVAAGEWFTDGWTGAILRGGELVGAGRARAQRAKLRAFLRSAVAASLELLA